MTSFLARSERFAEVGSTNDVVRAWPTARRRSASRPRICSSAGRGRDGRTWSPRRGPRSCSRSGSGPPRCPPDRVWRLAAVASLAMADAAETVAGGCPREPSD